MSSHTSQIGEFLEPALLSPVESYFWHFEKDMDGAFRVAVLLRVDGCIAPDILAAALRELQRRHPKLRAFIAERRDGRLHYEFHPVPPPIPFEITDHDGETPWRQEMRALLQSEIPDGGPMAAVKVLRCPARGCSELLFTMPHAIADGLSAIVILDDLLAAYARVEGDPGFSSFETLPMVSTGRAKSSGGWRSRWRLLRRFAGMKREEGRAPLAPLPEVPNIPPQSEWVHWVFSQEDTLALVRRCRKERVSLSGALIAAACCGLIDCLPDPEVLFKWQLPFNVREALEGPAGPVTPRDLGCFVSNMNGLLRIRKQADFWGLARQAHHELDMFMQLGGPSFGYNMASFFYNLRVLASRLLAGRGPRLTPSTDRRETLLATHYGVVNIRDVYGSLRPRECTLTFNNEITGPSLVMEALVLGQRLNVGFLADDLDPAFWEQLHGAVRNQLEAAIGVSKSRVPTASTSGFTTKHPNG